MRPTESFIAWFGPMLIFGIFVWVLFGNTSTHDLLCAGSHSCFRDWIFGLSGWAAAGAAAVTIGSLYKQANAQQKQTDFQLGDAQPTMDAVQHRESPKRAILRIQNWNRRSMIIREVRLLNAGQVALLHIRFDRKFIEQQDAAAHKADWTFAFGPHQVFEPAIILEGWIKREEAPPMIKLSLMATKGPDSYLEQEWKDVPVEIKYELVGIGRTYSQTARVHLASFATEIDHDIIEMA